MKTSVEKTNNAENVNNENVVVKQTAKVKANEKLLSIIDKSLFVTAKGQQKESVYKNSHFVDMSDREKKAFRRKLRSIQESFIESILNFKANNQTEQLKKIIAKFDDFYKEYYLLNDYSLYSICSANTEFNKQQQISKALQIIKEIKK